MKKQICAGGFIVRNDRFLFGKRAKSKTWAPCAWDIAGGRSLKNEHPLYTLKRELQEELGIDVLNAELLRSMEIKDRQGGNDFDYHIYIVTKYKRKPVNCSPEHTKIRWFTREELSKITLALPLYLSLIDDWMANKVK